jgi:enhancing lycopene biosynthesis protein 2
MQKFAVVLSGSGVFDGSEIHEATLTLYALSKRGVAYEIFAPDIPQHHVINHLTGEEMNESRNVLIESARIARGKIKPLSRFSAGDFDALILPGGFGAAKNLSSFAFKGAECKINPEVEKAIQDMVSRGKPIGALCIAPVILARILGNVEITIGDDPETVEAVTKMGATHRKTTHGQVVIDRKHKLFTTPCYMLDATVAQIGDGAMNVVDAMLKTM